MNFILIEDVNEKQSIIFENNFENLPNDTIAFTYYQQDNIDENGIVNSLEYRIGVPIKFIIGDMYNKLDYNTINFQRNDRLHCLYIHDPKKLSEPIKRIVKPINKNTTLVNNFSELEEVFTSIVTKEQGKKR